jgi:ankyrin repeat protein
MIDMSFEQNGLEDGEIEVSANETNNSNANGKKEGRSEKAQQLHRLIMQVCDARDQRDLDICLQRVSHFIDDYSSFILLERSVNKNSHLDDALHLPFERQENNRFAQDVSSKLLDLLVEKMKGRLLQNEFQLILSNKTNDGFTLLQHALVSGSEVNVTLVVRLLKKYPDNLKANLENVTTDKFTPLQQALASGSEVNVALVVRLLEQYPDILKANLANVTADKFMPLQHALKSGSKVNVALVVRLLEQYSDILKANLANVTTDKFMPLQSALASGSEVNVATVVRLLEQYPDILKANLANVTKDKFTTLLSALKSGSEVNIAIVVSLLDRYREAAKENIKEPNRFGYNCLHQAANSGNYEFVLQVVSLIEEIFAKDSANIIAKLKQDKTRFNAKAKQNPQIKAFLNQASSRPFVYDKNQGIYLGGGYRVKSIAIFNRAKKDSSNCFEKNRPYDDSRVTECLKTLKRVY